MNIVTICGSVRLGKEVWDRAAHYLAWRGKLVFTVNVWGKYEELHSDDPYLRHIKETLDLNHKRKIALSDEIHVLRKDHYIGPSTEGEIKFARSLNIPVKYIDVDDEWFQSSETSAREEI